MNFTIRFKPSAILIVFPAILLAAVCADAVCGAKKTFGKTMISYKLLKSRDSSFVSGASPQIGNTISGMVFAPDGNALSDVDIELLDEYSSLVSRSRTAGGGRFAFRGLQRGTYIVRVIPGRFGYGEQSQPAQLVGFNRGSAGYSTDSVYLDFHLQPLRRATLTEALNLGDAVFVQDVPNDARKLYAQAIQSLDQGKIDDGVSILQKAVKAFPNYFVALNRLGEELLKREDYKAAQNILNRAIEINSRSGSSFYLLGYVNYVTGKFESATKALRQAIIWSPQSGAACLLLGMSLKQSKNFEEAETVLLKAEVLGKKKMPDVYMQLALLHGNDMKKYAEAAADLEIYLKVQRDKTNDAEIRKLIQKFRDKIK